MPLKLFDAPDAITPETIKGLTGASQTFKDWALKILADGKLQIFIHTLSAQKDDVSSPLSALAQLSNTPMSELDRRYITLSDFTRRTPASLKRLTNILGHTTRDSSIATVYQSFGSKSHQALLEYVENHPLNREPALPIIQHTLVECKKPSTLSLFDIEKPEKKSVVLNEAELLEANERLLDLRKSMLKTMAAEPNLILKYLLVRNEIPHLACLLEPFFGRYVDELMQLRLPIHDYVRLYTFLSWASFIAYERSDLFTMIAQEVPVFSKRDHALSGGEIDGIVIPDIPAEKKPLVALFPRRETYVGSLMQRVSQIGKVHPFPFDLKLEYGDSDATDTSIDPDRVDKKPLTKHLDQIQQYLIKGNIATFISRHSQGFDSRDLADIWSTGPFQYGNIFYVFYDREPIVHTVALSPNEQEEIFRSTIAGQWRTALRNAGHRHYTNHMVRHVLSCVNGEHSRKVTSVQGCLFEPEKPLHNDSFPVTNIINHFRSFLDPFGIIETIKGTKNGTPRYEMHLDALLSGISAKIVRKSPMFDLKSGGFIDCINPGHPLKPGQTRQKTPSMHINFSIGKFKCFACEVRGVIALESIPEDMRAIVALPETPQNGKTEKSHILIPPDHDRCIRDCHKLLQSQFWGSKAEEYVEFKRLISPSLAFEKGAGFGTFDVIKGLFRKEYTLPELYYRGIIRFGTFVDSNSQLVRYLKRRGMTLQEMSYNQVFHDIELPVPKDALPYSPLIGKVSFPLTVGNLFTSLYLRKLTASDNPHYKLSRQLSGVSHGYFNGGILYEKTSEVVVTEGAFDALTLLMMGMPALALVGVNSTQLIEELAHSNKRTIYLSLDNDWTGEDKTRMRTKELVRCGFKGEIIDFTWDFLKKFPSAKIYKDWNLWWIKKGHRYF